MECESRFVLLFVWGAGVACVVGVSGGLVGARCCVSRAAMRSRWDGAREDDEGEK